MDGTSWLVVVVIAVILVVVAYWLLSKNKKPDDTEPTDREPKPDDTGATRSPRAAEKKASQSSAKEKKPRSEGGAKLPTEKEEKPPKKQEKKAKEETPREETAPEEQAKEAEEKKEEKKKAEAEPAPETKEEPAESKDDEAEADEEGKAEAAEEPERATEGEEAEEKAEEPAPRESSKPPVVEEAVSDEEAKKARKQRRKALRRGLKSTRGGFITKLGSLLKGRKTVDPELIDEIEEVLLTADVGVAFTERLIKDLKDNLSGKELESSEEVWDFIRDRAYALLTPEAPPWDIEREKPFVIMVIGVNGVGKTTTIAKLASRYVKDGKKVILAAGDTFRAAAVRQLEMWGKRVGAEVVKRDKQGSDPSSVVYDAIEKGVAEDADVVIADTAGRLHTKAPLMEELKKVRRVMDKAQSGTPHEVLLVLDANTGQNAIQQVQQFGEALEVTGIVLTKLDGTAKGGVILGITQEYEIPVRFIGVGERDDDLREFDADDFVEVLFERPKEAGETAA